MAAGRSATLWSWPWAVHEAGLQLLGTGYSDSSGIMLEQKKDKAKKMLISLPSRAAKVVQTNARQIIAPAAAR